MGGSRECEVGMSEEAATSYDPLRTLSQAHTCPTCHPQNLLCPNASVPLLSRQAGTPHAQCPDT